MPSPQSDEENFEEKQIDTEFKKLRSEMQSIFEQSAIMAARDALVDYNDVKCLEDDTPLMFLLHEVRITTNKRAMRINKVISRFITLIESFDRYYFGVKTSRNLKYYNDLYAIWIANKSFGTRTDLSGATTSIIKDTNVPFEERYVTDPLLMKREYVRDAYTLEEKNKRRDKLKEKKNKKEKRDAEERNQNVKKEILKTKRFDEKRILREELAPSFEGSLRKATILNLREREKEERESSRVNNSGPTKNQLRNQRKISLNHRPLLTEEQLEAKRLKKEQNREYVKRTSQSRAQRKLRREERKVARKGLIVAESGLTSNASSDDDLSCFSSVDYADEDYSAEKFSHGSYSQQELVKFESADTLKNAYDLFNFNDDKPSSSDILDDSKNSFESSVDTILSSSMITNLLVQFDVAVNTVKSAIFSMFNTPVLRDFAKIVFTRGGDQIVGFIVFVYQIYRSRSLGDYVAATIAWLRGLGVSCKTMVDHFVVLAKCVWCELKRWWNYNLNCAEEGTVVTESGFVAQLALNIEKVLNCGVVTALRNFFLAIVHFKLFSKPTANCIYEILGKPTPMSLIDWFLQFLRDVQKMINVGVAWFNGIPFTEALFTDSVWENAITEVDRLIRMKDATYTGLPVEGRMDLKEYIGLLGSNLKIIDEKRKIESKKTPLYRRLNDIYVQGMATFVQKSGEMGGGIRRTPVAVVVYGYPGSGKSKIIPYCASLFAKAKGRSFSPTHIFNFQCDSDFWDGYVPSSHPYIFFSEVGRQRKELVAKLGDPVIDKLISLIDSLPYICNMAFGDKGKVNFHGEMILIDTNNETMNLESLVISVAAYLRRFIFVHVRAKKEFCFPGSCVLDAKRSLDKGGNLLDRYWFDVFKYFAQNNTDVVKKSLCSGADIYEFQDVMLSLFRNHIDATERDIMAFAKYDSSLLNFDRTDFSIEDNIYVQAAGLNVEGNDLNEKYKHLFAGDLEYGNEQCPCSLCLDTSRTVRRHFLECAQYCGRFCCGKCRVDRDLYCERICGTSCSGRCRRENAQHGRSVEDATVMEIVNRWDGINELLLDGDIPESIEEATKTCRERVAKAKDLESTLNDEITRAISRDVDESKVISTPYSSYYKQDALHEHLRESFAISSDDEDEKYGISSDVTPYCQSGGLRTQVLTKFCTLRSTFGLYLYAWFQEIILVILFNKTEKFAKYCAEVLRSYRCVEFFTILTCVMICLHRFWCSLLFAFITLVTGILSSDWFVSRMCFKKFAFKDRLYAKVTNRFYNAVPGDEQFHTLLRPQDTKLLLNLKKTVAVVSALLAGGVLINKLVKWMGSRKKSDSPIPRSETGLESKQIVNLFERESLCAGSTVTRVKNKQNDAIWNVQQSLPLPAFNGDMSSLYDTVSRNVRFAQFRESYQCYSHVLGIFGSYGIFNRHSLLFNSQGTCKMRVSRSLGCHVDGSGWLEYTIHESNLIDVTTDIVMYDFFGLQFRNIVKHFANIVPSGGRVGMIMHKEISPFVHLEPLVVNSPEKPICLDKYISYTFPDHKDGMCGIPVVLEQSNGFIIGGVHIAGAQGFAVAYASVILKSEIENAIASMKGKSKLVPIFSQGAFSSVKKVEGPFPKSVFHYEVLHGVDYMGKIPGNIIMENPSSLVKSKIAKSVLPLLAQSIDVAPIDFTEYGKPAMKPIKSHGEWRSPYNIAMKNVGKCKKTLDVNVLAEIRHILTKRFITMLEQQGVKKNMCPLTVMQAINGVDGDDFIDRVKASASAGFGWPGRKSDYLPLANDGVTRVPTSEVWDHLRDIIEIYKQGDSYGFVFASKLKDEPRTIQKVLEAKTRVFFMTPLGFLIVSRMMLAPFYSLMAQFNEIFCTSVGINMHKDAHALFMSLLDWSEDSIEGDYKNYDQAMPHGIGETVNSVIYDVCKHFGYNDVSLHILQGVMTDNLFPIVEMLKDVFVAPGLQPSGKYGTAEDNSLRGLVMLLYAWKIHPDLKDLDFFRYVRVRTYGDDVVAPCKHPLFNNWYFRDVVRDIFGMDFTSATKTSELERFVHTRKISFLKRTFHFHEESKRYVARLDHSSILRALTWSLPSDHVSEEQRTLETVISMARELYFYGKKAFDTFRMGIIGVMSKTYNRDQEYLDVRIPTFHYLLNDLVGTEDHIERVDLGLHSLNVRDCSQSVLVQSGTNTPRGMGIQPGGKKRPANNSNLILMIKDLESKVEKSYKSILSSNFPELVSARGIALRQIIEEKNVPSDLTKVALEYHDNKVTLDRLMTIHAARCNLVKFQSGNMHEGEASNIVTDENFLEVQGELQDTVSIGKQLGPVVGQGTQLDIDDFFSRPIEIDAFQVITGSQVYKSYRVWDLYTLNPTVRAKLRNYAYFKANLHIRVSVSATPFHAGVIMCSYQPFFSANQTLKRLANSTLTFSDMRPLLLNYLSQSDGAFVMNIRDNKPMELVCPFMSSKPMHRLFNTQDSTLSASTSYHDLEHAGEVILASINPITAVSDNPSNVFFQVYAWATEVELGSSSGTWLEITTESGMDERETGPVESFASSAKRISSLLSSIPTIGPFATASSIAFGALESVAAIFGWSRPVTIDEPIIVKNQPYQNGANTIGYETNLRITLDPKQELTVSPSVLATERDDMVISSIAGRTSYLTSFTWAPTDVQMTPLWQSRVTPYLHTWAYDGDNQYFYQPTAMAFAVTPFAYWHGSITYRFEFVTSAFHRGKFGVYFEPNISQLGLINSDISLNKQFIRVVDIQETQAFEVTVRWASPRAWCGTDVQGTIENYGSNLTILRPEYCNGYITVIPFTRLQSPDGNSIPVNVYVRCDDLQVNAMLDRSMPNSRIIRTQSGVMPSSEVSNMDLNNSKDDASTICLYHFGERPVSFRALLKRYNVTRYQTIDEVKSEGSTYITVDLPIFPDNTLPYGATTPTLSQHDLISYLMYAYIGYRGGIRKRVRVVGECNLNALSQFQVSLQNTQTNVWPGTTIGADPYNASMNGTVHFVPHSNGGIEFECPFYSSNLFQFSFHDDRYHSDHNGVMIPYWVKGYRTTFVVEGPCRPTAFVEETAFGEDFCLMRYQGAPYFTQTE